MSSELRETPCAALRTGLTAAEHVLGIWTFQCPWTQTRRRALLPCEPVGLPLRNLLATYLGAAQPPRKTSSSDILALTRALPMSGGLRHVCSSIRQPQLFSIRSAVAGRTLLKVPVLPQAYSTVAAQVEPASKTQFLIQVKTPNNAGDIK